MSSDGVLASIIFRQFEKVIGDVYEKIILKNAHSHEIKMANVKNDKSMFDGVQLNDILAIKKLGHG